MTGPRGLVDDNGILSPTPPLPSSGTIASNVTHEGVVYLYYAVSPRIGCFFSRMMLLKNDTSSTPNDRRRFLREDLRERVAKITSK